MVLCGMLCALIRGGIRIYRRSSTPAQGCNRNVTAVLLHS